MFAAIGALTEDGGWVRDLRLWVLRFARDNHTSAFTLLAKPLAELGAWLGASNELNRMENEAWARREK